MQPVAIDLCLAASCICPFRWVFSRLVHCLIHPWILFAWLPYLALVIGFFKNIDLVDLRTLQTRSPTAKKEELIVTWGPASHLQTRYHEGAAPICSSKTRTNFIEGQSFQIQRLPSRYNRNQRLGIWKKRLHFLFVLVRLRAGSFLKKIKLCLIGAGFWSPAPILQLP